MSDDIVWSYRDDDWSTDRDLVGYEVWAADEGSVGSVDEATSDVSGSWLVVDTGPWIFGKKRLLPAGAVNGMDHERKRVMLDLTKDEVKDAPDYDADSWDEDARARQGDYYGPRVRGQEK